MNDIQQAAKLTTQALETSRQREAILKRIAQWAESNPYPIYGDYRDECSDEMIEALLSGPNGRQRFDDLFWEVEINASDHADWQSWESECYDEFCDDVESAWDIECDSFDQFPDDAQEIARENQFTDCSDLLRTMLRNSSPRIAATILHPDSPCADADEPGTIPPPNYTCDDDENKQRQQFLIDTFGIDGFAAESCYEHETLKAWGTLDLWDVYQKGLPTHIRVDSDTQLIFHTSWNGSGCMGPVSATKSIECPVRFKLDDADRYGIEAVYGMTGWSNELPVTQSEAWVL